MLWDKWTLVHAIFHRFFPFRVGSGTYIITTATLRVKEFGNILCISSIFSPPTFLGIEPHFLWHSSPGGKAEGNSCTLHEAKPLQSQEDIRHYQKPSLFSEGFVRATVTVQQSEWWQRLTRGIPAPLQPASFATCQQAFMQSFPEKFHRKSHIAACKRASVKDIRVDVNLDKLPFFSFLPTNAFYMQQLSSSVKQLKFAPNCM